MESQEEVNIYHKWDELVSNYDSYKRIPFKERKNHHLKSCKSFRYRVKCITKNERTYIFQCGYYYTSGTGSIFGSLYHACVGKYFGIDTPFIRAEIYQYINRHQITPENILYHSSSSLYQDGLFYNCIRSDTLDNFRLEMIDYLEHGIKRFPELI